MGKILESTFKSDLGDLKFRIGEQHRNRPVTVGVLVAVLILAVIAWLL